MDIHTLSIHSPRHIIFTPNAAQGVFYVTDRILPESEDYHLFTMAQA